MIAPNGLANLPGPPGKPGYSQNQKDGACPLQLSRLVHAGHSTAAWLRHRDLSVHRATTQIVDAFRRMHARSREGVRHASAFSSFARLVAVPDLEFPSQAEHCTNAGWQMPL
jgi:hypothetical protein